MDDGVDNVYLLVRLIIISHFNFITTGEPYFLPSLTNSSAGNGTFAL